MQSVVLVSICRCRTQTSPLQAVLAQVGVCPLVLVRQLDELFQLHHVVVLLVGRRVLWERLLVHGGLWIAYRLVLVGQWVFPRSYEDHWEVHWVQVMLWNCWMSLAWNAVEQHPLG